MRTVSRFSVSPAKKRAGEQARRRSFVRRLLHSSLLLIACAGFWVPGVRAQGTRKDDIVFNAQGRPMAGASVRICTSAATGQPCSPLANIYSDPALTQSLANPLTTDGLGNYSFYAAPGRYEIEISGPEIATKQLPNVILPNDPSTPTFASLSTTSGISAFSLSLGGSLTVSGSAAVTGTLIVGGAAVPSTAQANTWTAPQTFQGPTPWVDVAAYGARAIVAAGYTTTGTISSGSHLLTVAAAAQFLTGDGISVYGGGATCGLSTPGAPTVTPSIAAHATGTGVDVNAPAGSTASSYKVVALGTWSATAGSNCWGAYTPASAATSITTGNPLGSQTQTISTLSETAGVTTITCSSTCSMTVGAVVYVGGTSNDGFFGGSFVVKSVTNTTTFTVYTGENTSAAVTGTGGTLGWYTNNHITWSAVTGAFEYAIYGRTSGSWSLLGISWPGVTWWDDYGSTMSGNLSAYGWLPTTAPSSAQNGVLTTTVTAGGGSTSLTLAATATNSVTGKFATFDDAPIFAATATSAKTNGGPLFIPCNSSVAGARFVVGSYLQLAGGNPVNVEQCGSLWLDDPFEWDADLNWFGTHSGNNNGAASTALTGGSEIDVDTAYPGIYGPNATSMYVDHTLLNQYPGSNNALLSYLQNGGPGVVWTNSTWQTGGTSSSNDYMGIHLILGPNNSSPDNTFTNDSWVAGPALAANLTSTPLVIFQGNGQNHFDNCTFNRRTIAEVGTTLAIQVRKGCWNQGPITPFVMSNATSESIGGTVLEGINQDTSGQPVFANWAPAVYNGVVEISSPAESAPNVVTTGTGAGYLVLKDLVALPGQTQNFQNTGNSGGTGGSFFATNTVTPNLNNILYVDGKTYTTTDIGATLNAMYAALPSTGGTIVIPAGIAVNTSTPVTFTTAGKPVKIICQPGKATYIGWTSTSGTMFTFDTLGTSTDHPTGQGIEGCYLQTSGAVSSVAIQLSTTNGGEGYEFKDMTIVGFTKMVNLPSGGSLPAFNNVFRNVNCVADATCYYVGEASEKLKIEGGIWTGAGTGIDMSTGTGSTVLIDGTSCDGPTVTCYNVAASNSTLTWTDPHFENPQLGTFIQYGFQTGGIVILRGGQANDNVTTGTQSSPWFSVNPGKLYITDGMEFNSLGRTTSVPLITIGGTGTLQIDAYSPSLTDFTGVNAYYSSNALAAQLVRDISLSSGNSQQEITPLLLLPGSTSGIITHKAPAIAGTNTITDPAATGTTSLAVVEYCGATTGSTQACAKTVQTVPIIVWGDVLLNSASSQSITTLPFTDALYSCTGSDLTTAAGIVSFNSYAAASVTIAQSGGTNADHLRYMCVGH